jgi:hypothetical protein
MQERGQSCLVRPPPARPNENSAMALCPPAAAPQPRATHTGRRAIEWTNQELVRGDIGQNLCT